MKIGYRSFFVLASIIFFICCYYYYPFLSDDSLISLRYVQRFLEGKGLSWNDGHPVEGYSNLLWVLATSALGKLGLDLIFSVRLLGILCSLGTIGVILNHFRTQNIKREYVFIAIILLITTPCFAVWGIGGLEQPLYAFLFTLVLAEVSFILKNNNLKRIGWLSIWLGLLAITRPDGFLFTILASIFLLFIHRRKRGDLIKIGFTVLLIPTLFLLSQIAFRYSYYGELVPNTALVKAKITIHYILRGGFYNLRAFLGTLLLSGSGVYFLYILVIKKRNLFGVYLLLNLAAWLSYTTLVGGDIFPAFRHYYIVLVLFTFAIIFGLKSVKEIQFNNNKKIIIIILLAVNAYSQTFFTDNENTMIERWEFRGMRLGKTLKNTFSDQTLLAVTVAGCIPYSSELPTIDMLGLNDYYIPRHPPKNFGTGTLAHELGDGDYIMRRNPDIIVFHTGFDFKIDLNVGDQLKANKIFISNYLPIIAESKNEKYVLYFNKNGKSVGIKKGNNSLKIPGYFFKNSSDNISLFLNNKLLKKMEAGKTYHITIDNIPTGNWEIKESAGENINFQSKVSQKNNQLYLLITPKNKMFLETLELERKD
ncbi:MULTISPECIES: hypothetical protein [unclassified Chryseobacterium]|uniref:hypothetical protein n=1 Tax=unclassified Chryseobacterium TaxID=2593645 RepID=UPI00226A40AA|nr:MULTISPECIES: hypothetical protein [unclassified Chryseobacterium]